MSKRQKQLMVGCSKAFELLKWMQLDVHYDLVSCLVSEKLVLYRHSIIVERMTIETADGSTRKQENAFYVWPHRLSTSNTFLRSHYRNRRDILWDPHPSFSLSLQSTSNGSTWGIVHLEPVEDFFTSTAQIQYIHQETNYSWTDNDSQRLKHCFYQGHMESDQQSKVILSLCHGLTGHIRTSKGSYFIQPSENWDGQSTVRHVMYSIQQTFHEKPTSTHEISRPTQVTWAHPNASGNQESIFRHKRSISQERFVEILVVADGKMVSYHGDNLIHYILTLMSVVSLIYKDASIGNPIHIAVVRMLLLKDQEFVLKNENEDQDKGKSASEMLRNFCKWQRVFNDNDDRSPLHHDTALLITRENICRNPQLQKCDTLGLAELGTMCDIASSCSIVQDNGLSAAFTIAHELGHVLNMPHDDDFKCQRLIDTSGVQNVMSRMLDHNTYPWAWSNCSRYFLTEYLDGGYGDCLLDKPASDLLEPQNGTSDGRSSKRLPGENFDENKQCELVFGNGSKICPYMPPCKRLWCTTSGGEQEGCRTQHMPWSDGTACGKGRWCRHGSCVPRDLDTLKPVDGNWGPWQDWVMGTCSRPCGGGVQRSTRNCDSPAPTNGGTYCVGKRVRYRSCNTHECPPGTIDFREEQCAFFNNNNFNIQGLPADVKWVPKYTGINPKDRCRLYCRVEQSSAYYLLKDKVSDGTTCGPDTDDICVNGICKPASCNHVLGRKEQLDICGVCGGDNSTCVIKNGTYNQTQYGYNHVIRIPMGSSNIDIRQKGYMGSNRDDNYLALVDGETTEYLLNGNFVVSMFQKTIQYGGTTIEYSGSDAVMERLNSSKPLKRDLVVQVLSVGSLYPPDITYQYVVSRDKHPSYQWKIQDQWTACNRLCQGQQFRKPVCIQLPGQQKMAEEYCVSVPQPPVESQPCNTHCLLRWRVIQKFECSVHCGEGIRNVTKQCEQETLDQHNSPIPVDPRHCRHLSDNLSDTEPCIGPCDSAHWQFDHWSECSRTCGGGTQQRKARCVDDLGQVLAETHCKMEEKITQRTCRMESCPRWEVGDWTPCSVTCGKGESQRIVGCRLENGTVVNSSYCHSQERPTSLQICTMPPCPTEPSVTTTPTPPITTTASSAMNQTDSALPGYVPVPLILDPDQIDPSLNEINRDWKKEDVVTNVQAIWRTGDWGQCSETCGSGIRMRSVMCYDIVSSSEVSSPYCKEPIPLSVESCIIRSCVEWEAQEWSTCSVTCGKGISTRIVQCLFRGNRSVTEEEQCLEQEKPATEKMCHQVACGGTHISHSATVEHNHTSKTQWRTGSWGTCSKTCGGGFKRRQVVCHDDNSKVSDQCIKSKRPLDTIHCNTDPCPNWTYGEWSQCSKSCGGGMQSRSVICRDHLGQTVPDHRCHLHERPEHSQDCHSSPCPTVTPIPEKTYRWKAAHWTTCSKTCGKGFRHREVYCMENDGDKRRVSDDRCNPSNRPRSVRGCNKAPCPYVWNTEEWSECSHPCGPGIQHRRVTCHRVNSVNWIDPEPVSLGCNVTQRPPDLQPCNLGECDSLYHWKPSSWQPCIASCGEMGFQKRSLACLSRSGSRVSRSFCPKEFRPIRKRQCRAKPCGVRSCIEVQQKFKSKIDGEYLVLVGGKNISIYCHGMNSSSPKEYLTLQSGQRENYAEFYDKSLIRPDACPFQGVRNDSCECFHNKSAPGVTFFTKIRLNLTSLRVHSHDFTFARASRGQHRVGYGEAGDCFSTANCPQGRFNINLQGTGLRVSPHTSWVGHGNRASLWINRLEDNQKIHGKCGGYCGRCSPDPHAGLKLDIVPSAEHTSNHH